MAAYQPNVVIDSVYGVEILDESSFKKLTVLPPDTPITNKKDYSFNNKKIQVLNDKYLSSHDKAKCDITLGEIDNKYTVPVPFLPDVVELPKQYTKLKEIMTNKICYLDTCRKNLVWLLSFFTIYPDFGPVYEEYLLDPNIGIKLVDNIDFLGSAVSNNITRNDVKATVHLLLLLMAKNFDFDSENLKIEDQVKYYLKNRLKALRYVLKDSNIKFLLNMKNLDQMLFIWNSYPKLKSAVFYFAISIRSQAEINSATMLLAEYSMMTLLFVFKFINAKPETLAHTLPKIRGEAANFLKECEKLKENLGDLWTYVKVIRPDDTTLSISNFPYLFMAAAVYVKKFYSESTFFQRVVKPNSSGNKTIIVAAEKQHQPTSSWLTIEGIDNAMALTKNIEQWRAPHEMRIILRMDIPDDQSDAVI